VKDSYNLSRIAIAAGTAALEAIDLMQANVARVVATRARLTERLATLGYDVLPSATNFVLARRPGEDQGPVQRALREHGVLVRHFATDRLRDALRVSVGTEDETDLFLAALERVRG
jgi:histidinol-phosphate aminotransferase